MEAKLITVLAEPCS